MDKQRSKRKQELQDGFDMLFRNRPAREVTGESDGPIYAYVLMEELGYELKFDLYENEYQLYADGMHVGCCTELWEMRHDERLWDKLSILDEPDWDDEWDEEDED